MLYMLIIIPRINTVKNVQSDIFKNTKIQRRNPKNYSSHPQQGKKREANNRKSRRKKKEKKLAALIPKYINNYLKRKWSKYTY